MHAVLLLSLISSICLAYECFLTTLCGNQFITQVCSASLENHVNISD